MISNRLRTARGIDASRRASFGLIPQKIVADHSRSALSAHKSRPKRRIHRRAFCILILFYGLLGRIDLNRSRYISLRLSSRQKNLPFFVLLIDESPLLLNVIPRQPFKSDFSAGRVGAYCIRPTKCPAKGEMVDDKCAGGVFNTPLPGYPSDNRLNMEKRNTDLSLIVRDNR